MKKIVLYIARHGQTFFNKSERVQGWCDTPLTPEGATKISSLGQGLKEIPFKLAYSSDAGRAQETAQLVLAEHLDQTIPHLIEPRIREWGFGSFEGLPEAGWWQAMADFGNHKSVAELQKQDYSYKDMATMFCQLDQEGWAESYEVIEKRTLAGFTAIAENLKNNNGGNAFIVSHGLTIAHFLDLISNKPVKPQLENGSISTVAYEDGRFHVLEVGSTDYFNQ